MILDTSKYVGKCDCGRVHELRTKLVVCEYGALDNFDKYMDDCGLSGFRTEVLRPVAHPADAVAEAIEKN